MCRHLLGTQGCWVIASVITPAQNFPTIVSFLFQYQLTAPKLIHTQVCSGHETLYIIIITTRIIMTLREECRLRVFKNRILRRIFEPKRDENGEWRRLHNEEIHSLYRSPNIVIVI